MLDVLLKTSAVLAAAFLVAAAMRRSSAASRHVVWMAALVAVLLVPVAAFWGPSLAIRLPSPAAAPVVGITPSDRAARPMAFSSVRARSADPDNSTLMTSGAEPAPFDAVGAMRAIWVGGAAVLLLLHGWSAFRARQIGHAAVPADDPRVLARVADIAAQLRLRRPVRVMISRDNWMPLTWGAIRPTLCLPATLASWSDRRLDAVLAHELAHVARFDAVAQVVARTIVAVTWFNPLVWIAARRARLDREKACDDLVLALGARPSSYATDLLALLRSLSTRPAPDAGVAMARRTQIEQRVHSILSTTINRGRRSAASVVTAATILAAALPLAAAHPAVFLAHPVIVQEPQLPVPALMRTSSVIPEIQTPARPAPPANFSGTWVPKEPYRFRELFSVGLGNMPADIQLVIVQTDDAVTIQRSRRGDAAQDAPRPGFGPPFERESVHRFDTPNVRWENDRLLVGSQAQDGATQTTFFLQDGDLIVATSAVNMAGHRVEFSVSYLRVPESASVSTPGSITDAERQALSHPRPAGAELLNDFDNVATAPGTTERQCMELQSPVRSGESVAGVSTLLRRADGQVRVQTVNPLAFPGPAGMERTLWWSPKYLAAGLAPWLLEVRAVRLDKPATPGVSYFFKNWITVFSAQTPDRRRYVYPNVHELAREGRWMVIATAGPNWSCFVYGTASPLS
jgi:beta-lactamase regulating signal transducer with metallopeptidase domain